MVVPKCVAFRSDPLRCCCCWLTITSHPLVCSEIRFEFFELREGSGILWNLILQSRRHTAKETRTFKSPRVCVGSEDFRLKIRSIDFRIMAGDVKERKSLNWKYFIVLINKYNFNYFFRWNWTSGFPSISISCGWIHYPRRLYFFFKLPQRTEYLFSYPPETSCIDVINLNRLEQ